MKRWAWLLFISFAFKLSASCPIECIGRTEITYTHSSKGSWHKITSYDPVEIDWTQHLLRCLKSQKEPHTQIQFIDPERKIYADNLMIHYEKNKHSLNLTDLSLEGHVKILYQEAPINGSQPHIQYALAERVDYHPEDEKLILTAKKGDFVLYFDETNQTRMKALEVIISRNPETKKREVRGKGPVHFTFQKEELKKIKNSFNPKEPFS